MIVVTCEKCQGTRKVSDKAAGKRVECKNCGHRFRVAYEEPWADGENGIEPIIPPKLPKRKKSPKREKSNQKVKPRPQRPGPRVSWSEIFTSPFDKELLLAAAEITIPVAIFMVGFGFLFFFIALIGWVAGLRGVIVVGGLILTALLLRWHLGVIHRYAGNTPRIDSYDISLSQACGFLLITWGIALAITFPTVILPMKMVFGLILPETATSHGDWGFAFLLGLSFMLVYFQMAWGVYALTGDQNPAVVLQWLWKVLPGLPGLYCMTAVFVLVASVIAYIVIFLFTFLFAFLGFSLGAAGGEALRVFGDILPGEAVAGSLGIIGFPLILFCMLLVFGFAMFVYSYLNLVPFAMFGKFLGRYRHLLNEAA